MNNEDSANSKVRIEMSTVKTKGQRKKVADQKEYGSKEAMGIESFSPKDQDSASLISVSSPSNHITLIRYLTSIYMDFN